MFAIGPDFRKNYVTNTAYEQVDITATVGELMYFNMLSAKGKVITDIFTQTRVVR